MIRTLAILVIAVAATYAGMTYMLTAPPSTIPDGYTETTFDGGFSFDDTQQQYRPRRDIARYFTFNLQNLNGNKTFVERQWYGLRANGNTPRPTLVLLHGAGRNGLAMIDMWRDFALAENINLIAPNSLAKSWFFTDDGSRFMDAVLADAEKHFNIDYNQLYLFGHSSGGVMTHLLANRTNGPWKAVASHGGVINSENIRDKAEGVPITLYIGTEDEVFSLRSVRRASMLLAGAGHKVTLYTIPEHTHWYYDIGPKLAPYIWQNLTGQTYP